MAKFTGNSWQNTLRFLVWKVAQSKNQAHLRRLASVLEGLAAQVREKSDREQSVVLEAYPGIPVRYFSTLVGVSYKTGLALYKKWHLACKKPIPRQGRTDAGERKQWEEIVTQELLKRGIK